MRVAVACRRCVHPKRPLVACERCGAPAGGARELRLWRSMLRRRHLGRMLDRAPAPEPEPMPAPAGVRVVIHLADDAPGPQPPRRPGAGPAEPFALDALPPIQAEPPRFEWGDGGILRRLRRAA